MRCPIFPRENAGIAVLRDIALHTFGKTLEGFGVHLGPPYRSDKLLDSQTQYVTPSSTPHFLSATFHSLAKSAIMRAVTTSVAGGLYAAARKAPTNITKATENSISDQIGVTTR